MKKKDPEMEWLAGIAYGLAIGAVLFAIFIGVLLWVL